jgi:hypothetical protein
MTPGTTGRAKVSRNAKAVLQRYRANRVPHQPTITQKWPKCFTDTIAAQQSMLAISTLSGANGLPPNAHHGELALFVNTLRSLKGV